MKPEVFHTDPVGMGETRVQAATLLCRIFLHYHVLLTEWDGMLELWLKILDIMDRLMNSGQGDSLVRLTCRNRSYVANSSVGRGRTREPQEYSAGHGERWIPRSPFREPRA